MFAYVTQCMHKLRLQYFQNLSLVELSDRQLYFGELNVTLGKRTDLFY